MSVAVPEAFSEVAVLDFNEEKFGYGFWQEAPPLFALHAKEAGRGDAVLDPSFEIYELGGERGAVKLFTARRNGLLVGYAIFVVMSHPHFNEVLASQDLFYLAPSSRKGLAGYEFLRYCEKELERSGVTLIRQSHSVKKDIGVLFRRAGYELVSRVYERRI